jgi:hypothetical protein
MFFQDFLKPLMVFQRTNGYGIDDDDGSSLHRRLSASTMKTY